MGLCCIIAGSRTITDYTVLLKAIAACPFGKDISVVVSGGAPGVDSLGEQWAWERNLPIYRYKADWKNNGKAAGPIRNQLMADRAKAHPEGGACIVVWDGTSRGSADMMRKAETANLKTFLYLA